ncbi:MAG: arylesterase [Gammaproteobacteria bacterium]|nr:arylesterase [Gammaproteobacteria bacterium]MBU2678363.1 arylesterase [Gammaproteobacteria bacterium]NNC57369.1 arylesterase [Woeseiaceae bacterium]NNL52098.1 arylesterase [Woeseiaceae bacterium]
MRRILTLVVLLMAAGAEASESPTVLVFGDSLSAGFGIDVDRSWTALLQSRLAEQGYEHRVVNASISGETTEGGAARIDRALRTFCPDLIILELGGNDGLRGFPPERMRGNLEKIVQQAKASGASVVLLGIRIPTNYGPRYTAAFEAVYRQVADSLDVPWIEFFMEGVAMNDELLQADRIHPNTKAQPILLENAWPIISAALDDALSFRQALTK